MTNQEFSNQHIKFPEKFAYGFSNVGGNLLYVSVASFATIYYTDSIGLTAAVVGTMMVLARFFDAVSDIVMGTIIDKTNTKIGKARPWLLISILPLAVTTVLVYSMPRGASTGTQIVYMYITYILASVVCYTMFALPAYSMQALMTGEPKERVGLNSIFQMFGFVSIVLVNMLTSSMAERFGWTRMAMIYAVLAVIILLIAGLVCKERRYLIQDIAEESEERQPAGQKVSTKHALAILFKNKYFYIVLLLSVMNYITIGTFNTGGVYYATYILNNANLFGVMTLATMGPTVVVTLLIPQFVKKFSKKQLLIIGYIIQTVGFIIAFMANDSLAMLLVGIFIKGIGLAPVAALLIPMIGDIIELEYRRKGVRMDGILNAASSFGTKVGTGLGSAFVGWFLAVGGYVANAAVQLDSAYMAMRILIAGIPVICCVLGLILALFFNIERDIAATE